MHIYHYYVIMCLHTWNPHLGSKKTKNSILLIISYKKLMMHSLLSNKYSTQFGVRGLRCDCWLHYLLQQATSTLNLGLLIQLMEIISPSMSKHKRTKQITQSPLSEHSICLLNMRLSF